MRSAQKKQAGLVVLPGACRASFTLIELLVVMLIIVILAGITLSVSKYAAQRARQARSLAERQKIEAALEEYRAIYGEYPIPGDPAHYSRVNLSNTLYHTLTNMPERFWEVDLSGDPIEILPFTSSQRSDPFNIDYSLTYPLYWRPKADGRAPFLEFPEQTICYLVWRKTAGGIADYVDEQGRKGVLGYPITRIVARDPGTGKQWLYESTDGLTYQLTTRPLSGAWR
ncbi:MAG: type II secretion system protein [Lentisphaerae bacterium]|nr:type II secretion system protein [Lentisphaerota bacterium]